MRACFEFHEYGLHATHADTPAQGWYPWEPDGVELPDGRLYFVWRGSISDNENDRILYNWVSADLRSFSPLYVSNFVSRRTPPAVIHHEEIGMVEVFNLRRDDEPDQDMFRAIATYEDAMAGDFSHLGALGITINAADNEDPLHGYTGAVRVGPQVFVCYYDENATTNGHTEIYLLVGNAAAARLGTRDVPGIRPATASTLPYRASLGAGLIAGYDLTVPRIAGVYDANGAQIREIREAPRMDMVVRDDADRPTYDTTNGYFSFTEDTACGMRQVNRISSTHITTDAIAFGMIITARLTATPTGTGLLIGVYDPDSQNVIAAIRYNPTLGLGAWGEIDEGSKATINAGAPSLNAWTVWSAWWDNAANTIELWTDATSEGTASITPGGTGWGGKMRLVIGGTDLGAGDTFSAAIMDAKNAWFYQDKEGFDTARAYLAANKPS